MGVPPSTVSRRIAALESALGTALILRTTRRFALTDDGRAFAERCRGALEEIEAATSAIENRDGELKGTLRVSAPAYVCPDILGSWLLEFAAGHPALSIDLRLTNREPDLVEEGIDLSFQVGPLRDQRHIARRLWTFPYRLCGAAKFLAAHPGLRDLRHPRDLAGYPCVVTPPLESWRFEHAGLGDFTFVPANPVVATDDWRVGTSAVRMGMGLGYLPDALVEADLGNGLVEIDLSGWQPVARDLFVVYPALRQLSRKVRAAIDFALSGRAAHGR